MPPGCPRGLGRCGVADAKLVGDLAVVVDLQCLARARTGLRPVETPVEQDVLVVMRLRQVAYELVGRDEDFEP